MILKGKKGLVVGIANNHSIASAIAKTAYAEGAEILVTYQSDNLKKRVAPLCEEINSTFMEKLDIQHPDDIDELGTKIAEQYGKIDFIVHSIAFANKEDLKGRYLDTSLENFLNSMHISCYSLVSLIKGLEHVLAPNSSILTLSYYGAQKVIPNYNIMGVCKAALEASVKYLAYDLGKDQIRINAISAGAIKTLSSSAIGGINDMIKSSLQIAPLKINVTQEDIAKSALYFLSDLSSAVTGEIHYVDAGFNTMGAGYVE